MARVLLDTNFILYSIANKVDFHEELLMRGHRVVIPREVILEIKRLKAGSKALKFREEAELALKLIDAQDFDLVDCPGKYVDVGIRAFLKDHPTYVLATMDKELKKNVSNRKMVLRNKKKLELQ